MIRPIPAAHGVGFCSMERLPQYAGTYREEQTGRYWNYHVTPDSYGWPDFDMSDARYLIDGFAPNLNKSLHVGHLRQLALAKSLSSILNLYGSKAEFVALLGASQGVYKSAEDELAEWFDFLKYKPKLYYDVLMPKDSAIVPRRAVLRPDASGRESEVEVWDGPGGEVIVRRSDGRHTYAFHDLAFAATVAPTHYITGVEQKTHFESLGLGGKHLGMGLVLGADGKKMKSRTGDSVTAEEALGGVLSRLEPTPEPRKLAWNVLAWNFLQVARSKDVKYTPEAWTKPDAPGMYISYTHARIGSALKAAGVESLQIVPSERKALNHPSRPGFENLKEWSAANPDPHYDLTQADAELIGFASQRWYYVRRATDTLDPTTLAGFTYDLATRLGAAYHAERVQGGRYGFMHALNRANSALRMCMYNLGMFPLERV